MKSNEIVGVTLLLSSIGTSLVGCSHSPTVQEFPESAMPGEEVSRLDADLTAAAQKQYNVLSPRNFKEATEAFLDAKSKLEKNKDSKDVLHEVAVGRAYLQKAMEFGATSESNMSEVVVARREAIAAGAPEFYPDDLKKADSDLRDVTEDVEKNHLDSVKERRTDLQRHYLEIELKSLKKNYPESAHSILDQAKQEGAKEHVPRTLAVAEKSADDAEAFITANRHDYVNISNKSKEALAHAEHALKITRESKLNNKTSPEEISLRIEKEQALVGDKEVTIQHQNTKLESLQQDNQELTSEQIFNQKYEAARELFSESEAEVYKKGNTLLIRLKKLNFPTGKAVLKGSDFKLLAKVQNVIEDFGAGKVTIGGHTDSKGSKQINERLSLERADAVKNYLEANAANGDEDITTMEFQTIGYGDQRPLTSNKSAKDRATNRRVDIVITPVAHHTGLNNPLSAS